MPQVIVLQGVPGSGKTAVAKDFVRRHPDLRCVIVSADDFFVERGGGTYAFDVTLLTQAHAACFRQFVLALQQGVDVVIVDNTNSTAWEMEPYMLGAEAFGYNATYWRVSCDPEVAAARNIHDVPVHVVHAIHERMLNEKLPPWWRSSLRFDSQAVRVEESPTRGGE